MRPVTLDDVHAGSLREAGHLNYGPDGFGYAMTHSTIPRLACVDRYFKGEALKKSGKRYDRLWSVDGEDVADLEEAVARLGSPPVTTGAEDVFLRLVPTEWAEFRPFLTKAEDLFAHPGSAHSLVHTLQSKGLVQVERREAEDKSYIRRTPAEDDDVA